MMSHETKPIFVRLPTHLTREIKRDMVDSEETLREWMQAAAEDRLRRKKGELAGSE